MWGVEPTREILACNTGPISPQADAMFERFHHTLARLLAAVLLITISMHAAMPATAFEQVRGLAFSATTNDVAVLASFRQTERRAARSVQATRRGSLMTPALKHAARGDRRCHYGPDWGCP